MNKQEFLDHLVDPVGSNINRGIDEFHERWDKNIDVLNVIETKGRGKQPRHWMVHIFTVDELLVRSFTDSLIHYVTKHHSSAWLTVGFYDAESHVLPIGILEYKMNP